MSTIAENLTKLAEDRDNIATAISGKGVTVPEGSKLSEFPEMIEGISTGGSPEWFGGSWQTRCNIPFPSECSASVVYNGEIHILGSSFSIDYKYDWSQYHYKWNGTNWISVSTLPTQLICGNAVVYNNEIHILCDRNHYKWNGSSWSSVSTLPYDFYCGSAVVYNNEIHILGGQSAYSGSVTFYNYHYKWNGTNWISVSALPNTYYRRPAVIYNNDIYILGVTNKEYLYKFNGSSWVFVSSIPYSTIYGNAVVINNEIHLFGGKSGLNLYYKYDGTSWKKINYSTLIYMASALVYNEYIVAIGGYSYNIKEQCEIWSIYKPDES